MAASAVSWGLWVAADDLHLEWVALYFATVAIGLIAATAFRPGWFWDRGKSVILRDLLGDRGTIICYLCIALGGLGVLSWREMRIVRERRYCLHQLAAASSVHERVRILYGSTRPTGEPKSSVEYNCEQLTHEHLP